MKYYDEIKYSNCVKILQYIHQSKRTFRKQIAENTHLASQTVINLIKELVKKDFVTEIPIHSSSQGRTPLALEINYSNFSIISIELSVSHCYCFLNSIDSKIIEFVEVPISSNIIEDIKKTISNLLKINIDSTIMAIIVSVEGLVEKTSGLILVSKDLGLTKTDLSKELKDFKIPVFVRNDVNLIAYCKSIDDESLNNSLVIKLDKGVGSSLILENHVLYNCGNFGELGHISVLNDLNNEKRQCKCGKVNCLTCFISQDALEKDFKGSFEDLVIAFNNGDEKALAILKNGCDKLAFALSNITTLLDLEKIVICGKTAKAFESFLIPYVNEKIKSQLSYWVPFREVEFEKIAPTYALSSKFFIRYSLNHFCEYRKMVLDCGNEEIF